MIDTSGCGGGGQLYHWLSNANILFIYSADYFVLSVPVHRKYLWIFSFYFIFSPADYWNLRVSLLMSMIVSCCSKTCDIVCLLRKYCNADVWQYSILAVVHVRISLQCHCHFACYSLCVQDHVTSKQGCRVIIFWWDSNSDSRVLKNWDSESSPWKSPDSDSGLKSNTDSWTCVIVTVYTEWTMQTDKFHKLLQIRDRVSVVWSITHNPLFHYIL